MGMRRTTTNESSFRLEREDSAALLWQQRRQLENHLSSGEGAPEMANDVSCGCFQAVREKPPPVSARAKDLRRRAPPGAKEPRLLSRHRATGWYDVVALPVPVRLPTTMLART